MACRWVKVTFAAMILWVLPAAAQNAQSPIPTPLQTALYRKIFSFNRTFGKTALTIWVVYLDKQLEGPANELASQFSARELKTRTLSLAQFKGQSDAPGVIYILSEAPMREVEAFCELRSVLSVASNPALVRSKNATVSLGIRSGQPEILVNLSRMRAEGQDLSADLLRLATVVP